MERELPYAGMPGLDSVWGDRQGIDEAMCAGIISGLAYTVKFLPPNSSSCRPESVTTGQMVRVVVAYIERRPERMHEDFRRLATLLLAARPAS